MQALVMREFHSHTNKRTSYIVKRAYLKIPELLLSFGIMHPTRELFKGYDRIQSPFLREFGIFA